MTPFANSVKKFTRAAPRIRVFLSKLDQKSCDIVNLLTTSEPADRKLFAGPRVRRLRQGLGLTQSRMAGDLGLSVSYLNLLERNQRPLTAAVLLKLADVYDLDIRQFTAADADRRTEDIAAAIARGGAAIGRAEVRDFAEQFPDVAAAVLRLADAGRSVPPGAGQAPSPLGLVRDHLLDRGNHFAALDAHAEALADELRLSGQALDAAVRERLRARHGLNVRVLPSDVMPDKLRRFDFHNRQVLLSEALDGASRTFQLCIQLAHLEARTEIEAELAAAAPRLAPADPFASQLLATNLASYWAAALMMPYGRFHAAAESLGYDMELLQARFSAGFEQVAHRLTTLQRPGARGIPFMLLRTDRAGQISKRFAAGRLPFAAEGGQCPLWVLYAAFEHPGRILTQIAEAEGEKLFTIARTVRPQITPWGAEQPRFAIALVCALDHARALVYAGGVDLNSAPAVPIGPGCAACFRPDCRQRSAPPAGAQLSLDQGSRGLHPYGFTAQRRS